MRGHTGELRIASGILVVKQEETAMSFAGTVVNGSIVLDGSPRLPEGSRVDVELVQEDDLDAELASCPPQPQTETYEEVLESLRQSYAEIQAGARGMSIEEAFAKVDLELRKQAESGKCTP
jgi:predicted DNA-binding antitoxin AbrB/MazE fold protein